MNDIEPLPPDFIRVRRIALFTGVVALVLCGLGWMLSAQAFYRAYLFAWLFYLGITLGSMAWVMIHHLVGGGWGRAIQRIAEAASLNLPLLLLLFIPILLGVHSIYPWADPLRVVHDAILRHKAPYLNLGFWTVRLFVYFLIWIGLSAWLANVSHQYDTTRSASLSLWMRRASAGGLVLYVLTMSLAGVDWIMSREPHYYSTIFGFILVVGHALSALLVLIIVLTFLIGREPLRSYVTLAHYNDLGNLLLTCVILWAYVAFAQYLITWSGTIQEEVKWYYLRSKGINGFLAAMMILLHFFVPFLLLLLKDVKRRPVWLAWICAGLLFMRFIDLYWMVVPTGEPITTLNRLWLNIAAPIGIGGVWLSSFIWHLARRPLLAVSEHAEPSTAMENKQDPETGPHGERHAHPA